MSDDCVVVFYEITESRPIIDSLAIILCSVFGFIAGIIAGALLYICCYYQKNKDKLGVIDVEEHAAVTTRQTAVHHEPDRVSLHDEHPTVMPLQTLQVAPQVSVAAPAPAQTASVFSSTFYPTTFGGTPGNGIFDAYVYRNKSAAESNLLKQRVAKSYQLETDIRRHRYAGYIQVVRQKLVIFKEKIKSGWSSFCESVCDKLKRLFARREMECRSTLEYKIQQIDQKVDITTDRYRYEEDMRAAYEEYNQQTAKIRMEAQKELTSVLEGHSELSLEDIESFLQSVAIEIQKLEGTLQQVYEQRSSTDQGIEDEQKIRLDGYEQYEKTLREKVEKEKEVLNETLNKMVERDQLPAQARAELMKQFEQEANAIVRKAEQGFQSKKQEIGQQCRDAREEKMKELTSRQDKTLEGMLQDAETSTDGSNYLDKHLEAMATQGKENATVQTEFETDEAEKMDEVLYQATASATKDIGRLQKRLAEQIKEKATADPDQVDKILKVHQQQRKLMSESINKEFEATQQRVQDDLQRRLKKKSKKGDKSGGDGASPADWKKQLKPVEEVDKKTVELVIKDSALNEEEKERILREHENGMSALKVELSMRREREQKMLEARLLQRKAAMAAIRQQQEDLKNQESEMKRADFQRKMEELESQYKQEEQRLLEEQERDRLELKKRLSAETESMVAEQQKSFEEMLTKYQVARARRMAQLEAMQRKAEDKVLEMAGKKKSVQEKAQDLIEVGRHYEERIDETARENREKAKGDLLKRMKEKKEQEEQLEAEKEGKKTAKAKSEAMSAFTTLLFENRHKRAMEQLETDFQEKVASEKQRMANDFETNLMTQMNQVLAQIITLGSFSEAEVSEITESAAQEIDSNAETKKKFRQQLDAEIAKVKSSGAAEPEKKKRKKKKKKAADEEEEELLETIDPPKAKPRLGPPKPPRRQSQDEEDED